MRRKTKRISQQTSSKKDTLYTMEIFIIDGPVSEKFIKRNPVISRTIEIQGDQTLEDFHRVIFNAFEREEEHMYEFQIGGKGPNDPKAKRYVLAEAFESPVEETIPKGNISTTRISSLKLKLNESFGYWFDFGDDWWHQINVISIKEEIPDGKYPRVINRVGESPPQYPDLDE
jgi:hypothetical protein